MRRRYALAVVARACAALTLACLGACGDAEELELRRWLAEQRAQARPAIAPLTEPKRFFPQSYAGDGRLDPFDVLRLTQAMRRDAVPSQGAGLIAPELSRRKEPLESFPLDAMTMVGSMSRDGRPVALVRVDKLLYQVRVGSHLGLHYGRVGRITEAEVLVRELVQDTAGGWVERVATLQLQDRSK